MLTNIRKRSVFQTPGKYDTTVEVHKDIDEPEAGTLEITGTGTIRVTNTGGSSASEGGTGSGSSDDAEKGDLSKTGEKSGNATSNDDSDLSLDPIKKNVREAEKTRDKE